MKTHVKDTLDFNYSERDPLIEYCDRFVGIEAGRKMCDGVIEYLKDEYEARIYMCSECGAEYARCPDCGGEMEECRGRQDDQNDKQVWFDEHYKCPQCEQERELKWQSQRS